MARREQPIPRVNPSGKKVWIARYTDSQGRRRLAKPGWNRGKGTFTRRRDAQRAIDEAYGLPDNTETVRGFFASWTEDFPRSERTNETNEGRIRAVLEAPIEGRPLGDWQMAELRRSHVNKLVSHLLIEQGRAPSGAANVLRTLSAMMEDAIDSDLAGANPFRGVKVRANDPRAKKRSKKLRTWTFEQMREFAAAGRPEIRKATKQPPIKGRRTAEHFSEHNYEPMLLTFALTGMRLGEILALRRDQLRDGMFNPTGTAWRGRIIEGDTDEKVHDRPVPCPASLEFLIQTEVTHEHEILFPTPSGKVWNAGNFYRDVWRQARIATGMDITPHECRHSYVTHLRAAGIDDADLAAIAGHRVETMLTHYTHSTGQSFDQIREVLG